MKLNDLIAALNKATDTFPRFVSPHGDRIPAHAHIAEVADAVKNFVDCGGVTSVDERSVGPKNA